MANTIFVKTVLVARYIGSNMGFLLCGLDLVSSWMGVPIRLLMQDLADCHSKFGMTD
jgi:hypothetical protein